MMEGNAFLMSSFATISGPTAFLVGRLLTTVLISSCVISGGWSRHGSRCWSSDGCGTPVRSAEVLATEVPSNRSSDCSDFDEARVLSSRYSGRISAETKGLV